MPEQFRPLSEAGEKINPRTVEEVGAALAEEAAASAPAEETAQQPVQGPAPQHQPQPQPQQRQQPQPQQRESQPEAPLTQQQRQIEAASRQWQAEYQEFQRAVADPELAELREDDPAEWSARRQELVERYNNLVARGQQIDQATAQHNQAEEAHRVQAHQKMLEQEERELRKKVPNWGPELKAKVREFLRSRYTDAELDQVYDHRHILSALDAMRGEEVAARRGVRIARKSRVENPVVKIAQRQNIRQNTTDYAALQIEALDGVGRVARQRTAPKEHRSIEKAAVRIGRRNA